MLHAELNFYFDRLPWSFCVYTPDFFSPNQLSANHAPYEKTAGCGKWGHIVYRGYTKE